MDDLFGEIEKSKKVKKSKTKTDKKSKKPKAKQPENEVVEIDQIEKIEPVDEPKVEVIDAVEEDHNDGWLDDDHNDDKDDVEGKMKKLDIKKTKRITVKDEETGLDREEDVEYDEDDEEARTWDMNKLDEEAPKKVEPQKQESTTSQTSTKGLSFTERMKAGRMSGATPGGSLSGGPVRRGTRNRLHLDEKTLKDTSHFPTLGTAPADKRTPVGFKSVNTNVNNSGGMVRQSVGNSALNTSNRFGGLDC